MCLSKAILEAINELVHLELLTDSEFAANVNFSSLRNLASNELFFTSFISLQQPLLFLYIFSFYPIPPRSAPAINATSAKRQYIYLPAG